MTTTSRLFTGLFLLAAAVAPGVAQDRSLNGRSAIEICLGFWGGTSGFTGSIDYAYWLREGLALTLTGGLLSAKASSAVNRCFNRKA